MIKKYTKVWHCQHKCYVPMYFTRYYQSKNYLFIMIWNIQVPNKYTNQNIPNTDISNDIPICQNFDLVNLSPVFYFMRICTFLPIWVVTGKLCVLKVHNVHTTVFEVKLSLITWTIVKFKQISIKSIMPILPSSYPTYL